MPSLVNPVKTALLLAAGTGSRLNPLTNNAPKCLTELNGIPLVERLVEVLKSNGIERLVVVVGYLDSQIREHLNDLNCGLKIEYVSNSQFRTTNNIYSLWLARRIINEPFLLLECDLVFEPDLLLPLMEPDRIAVSQRLPWMNGTTVTVDASNCVTALHSKTDPLAEKATLKTVNLYSFSEITWSKIVARLDIHVKQGQLSEFYEIVLTELVKEREIFLRAVCVNENRWYEVDTISDLRAAEIMFPSQENQAAQAYA